METGLGVYNISFVGDLLDWKKKTNVAFLNKVFSLYILQKRDTNVVVLEISPMAEHLS